MNQKFEIPNSWLQVTLGEVVEYGKTIKADPQEIPDRAWVLELEDIEKDTSKLLKRLTFSERQSRSTKNQFEKGDILYGKLRPYLNKVLRADMDGYCSTEIIPLKPNQALDGNFLFHWLKHPGFLKYVDAVSHGLNMPRLGTQAGRKAPLLVAPILEQRRIAEKLDHLFEQVDACRKKCERIPFILKQFRQSILAAATSGKLTENWRHITSNTSRRVDEELNQFNFSGIDCFREYEFPASWETARLEEIAEISGGITKDSKRQDPEDEELPYLRVANVQRGYLDLSEMKTIRVPKKRIESLLLERGDILFNEGGDIDKLGRGWVWNGEIEKCTFQNHVFRARLRNCSFEPKFFSWYGNSRGFDYFLSYGKQSTNLASINKTVLSSLPVVVPPSEEQKEIVRRVESLFSFANRLEARYKAAIIQVERLISALLEKAFRGELVPQDPNDESAAALLERVRNQLFTTKANETGRQVKNTTSTKSPTEQVVMLTRKDIEPSHLTTILKKQGALSAEELWVASQLEIDDFYDQLKAEEEKELLRERRGTEEDSPRFLEAA
ncbi:restriction endonuclease subunit S [Nodosilinea sp. E11]|uniref:restriction endonuclease subunit S n=1 Tax=Nodosilinea sp. E11 TaxID=3037479 RepID=UPI002934525D|nr:restriction endonuclease subunit S [Nodosilinea sp. E11]WOD41908.1 restriction endonuclease subunit S [Nodosilinea sp. E11]